MTKRMMKVLSTWEMDHTKDSLGEALGADYEKARSMAMQTIKLKKTSEAIEDMMFNNNEPLQTRILAVFIAGTIRGNRPPIIAIGELKIKPPEGGGL